MLNKAIDEHRRLFDVVHGETGVSPAVPLSAGEPGFCVQDAIADTVADWLEALWEQGGRALSPLPAYIYADEDYGTTTPRSLPADSAQSPR